MNRKDRHLRAQQRRKEVREELLAVMQKKLEETGDFKYVCERADRMLNAMVEGKPQEKSLLLAAARELADEIELIFQAIEKRDETGTD